MHASDSRRASVPHKAWVRLLNLSAVSALSSVLALLSAEHIDAQYFSDVTTTSQLEFVHESGERGMRWLAEILGPGVGVLDFDGDGKLDVWVVQGGALDGPRDPLVSDQLFLNRSTTDQMLFERITHESNVEASRYGMGIATGDIDRDGDLDVFLANFGVNEIWMNRGDATFEEFESTAGSFPDEWSVAGSFADFDSDGALDLYVVNYVDFRIENHKECLGIALGPDYCAPTAYTPTPDRLYVNSGNGLFEERSSSSNLDSHVGAGLGVLSADLDGDQLLDIYVANDPTANFLWRNRGKLSFENVGMVSGSAVNGDGKSEASMGVDGRDFDNDCDVDLFMTNLTAETNSLFLNSGEGWFVDGTNKAKLGASSFPYTGFGTAWLDVDLDGDLDLFAANGAVSLFANAERSSTESSPLAQRNQLWLNNGNGEYVEVIADEITTLAETSRGAAFADLDNDGDTDILVANNGGELRVYKNVAATGNNWIGLTVNEQGTLAFHAKVELIDHHCRSRVVRTDGSYASANDPRVVFGLGQTTTEPSVRITWLDGTTSRFGPLALNTYHTLNR